MRIAAIQMTSTPLVSENLRQAADLLHDALDCRPDLIAFPELFNALPPHAEGYLSQAENLRTGLTVQTLQEWAAENEIWILGGSLALKVPSHPDKVSNTSLLIDSTGEIRARYDKVHLFQAEIDGDQNYDETQIFINGKKAVTCSLDNELTAGLSICYDLRFPELYRKFHPAQPEVIFAPSAFTNTTGKAHWDLLTRTRAIENQAYLIAPAQFGQNYPGRETYGHTRIVDPWGRVIAERMKGPGFIWADIQPDLIAQVRTKLPALKNRRFVK